MQKAGQIIGSRKSRCTGKCLRVAQRDVYGMVAAQAAPQCKQLLVRILLPDQRNDIRERMLLILHMTLDALARRGGYTSSPNRLSPRSKSATGLCQFFR